VYAPEESEEELAANQYDDVQYELSYGTYKDATILAGPVSWGSPIEQQSKTFINPTYITKDDPCPVRPVHVYDDDAVINPSPQYDTVAFDNVNDSGPEYDTVAFDNVIDSGPEYDTVEFEQNRKEPHYDTYEASPNADRGYVSDVMAKAGTTVLDTPPRFHVPQNSKVNSVGKFNKIMHSFESMNHVKSSGDMNTSSLAASTLASSWSLKQKETKTNTVSPAKLNKRSIDDQTKPKEVEFAAFDTSASQRDKIAWGQTKSITVVDLVQHDDDHDVTPSVSNSANHSKASTYDVLSKSHDGDAIEATYSDTPVYSEPPTSNYSDLQDHTHYSASTSVSSLPHQKVRKPNRVSPAKTNHRFSGDQTKSKEVEFASFDTSAEDTGSVYGFDSSSDVEEDGVSLQTPASDSTNKVDTSQLVATPNAVPLNDSGYSTISGVNSSVYGVSTLMKHNSGSGYSSLFDKETTPNKLQKATYSFLNAGSSLSSLIGNTIPPRDDSDDIDSDSHDEFDMDWGLEDKDKEVKKSHKKLSFFGREKKNKRSEKDYILEGSPW